MPAPELSKTYWRLRDGATMRDLLLAVRADEAWCVHSSMCAHVMHLMRFHGRLHSHSHVNHTLASLGDGAQNPFRPCGGHTGGGRLPHNFVEPPPDVDIRTGGRVAAGSK